MYVGGWPHFTAPHSHRPNLHTTLKTRRFLRRRAGIIERSGCRYCISIILLPHMLGLGAKYPLLDKYSNARAPPGNVLFTARVHSCDLCARVDRLMETTTCIQISAFSYACFAKWGIEMRSVMCLYCESDISPYLFFLPWQGRFVSPALLSLTA
jgi:hypothetical protein